MSNRLFTGISILLFVLVAGFVIALASLDSINAFDSTACPSGNATACAEESQGQSGFLDTMRAIDPFTFEGAPTEVNIIFASVLVVLMVGAILSIVFFFIPTTGE